jgi:hypothetical protein
LASRDGLVIAAKGLQRQHRAEHLVLHDLVGLFQVRQHRRLDVLRAERVRSSTPEHLGAGGHRAFHEAQHALDLFRVDHRGPPRWPRRAGRRR